MVGSRRPPTTSQASSSASPSTYVGPWLDVTMQVLVVSSFVAMLIGMQNMFARYGFALARAGVLPEAARPGQPAFTGSGCSGTRQRGHRRGHRHRLPTSPAPTPSRSSTPGSSPWATVGFIVMMALASLAIIAFFIREKVGSAASGRRRSPPSCRSSSWPRSSSSHCRTTTRCSSARAPRPSSCSGSSRSRSRSALLPVFKKDIDYKTVTTAVA